MTNRQWLALRATKQIAGVPMKSYCVAGGGGVPARWSWHAGPLAVAIYRDDPEKGVELLIWVWRQLCINKQFKTVAEALRLADRKVRSLQRGMAKVCR